MKMFICLRIIDFNSKLKRIFCIYNFVHNYTGYYGMRRRENKCDRIFNFFSKISGYLQDFSLEKYEGIVNDPSQMVIEDKYVVSFTKEPPRNSEKIFIFLKMIFSEAYIKGISSIPIPPMCIQLTSKFHELVSKNNQPRISLKKIATTWEEQCSTRILFIKGSHGTGKSHFVASLQHESPYSSYAFLDYTYCSMVKDELIGIMAKHIASQLSESNKKYKKS